MKKGERRKNELIKIAYKKFLENGYEQTSVDEIIEEAQIAKGTYYYYFQSKEQMLEEVVEMMMAKGSERAAEVLKSDLSVPEKIVGIMLAYRPMADELIIRDTLKQRPVILAEFVYAHLCSGRQHIHSGRILNLNLISFLIRHNITSPFKYGDMRLQLIQDRVLFLLLTLQFVSLLTQKRGDLLFIRKGDNILNFLQGKSVAF